MERETGFADANGARLYYERSGAGPNVALLHEGIADAGMWDEQVPVLEREFRVLRYDLRGFGRSSLPGGPFSQAGDLAALLRRLEHAPAAVVGASAGASAAIEATLEHSELVRALVLVVPALGGFEQSAEMQRIDAEEEALIDAGDIEGAVEHALRTWVDGPRRTPEAVDPVLRERVRGWQRRAYEIQVPAFTGDDPPLPQRLDPPARTRLHEIHVPTLVVATDLDQPDPIAVAELLEREIPGARREVIHGAAHLPNMERSETFNRLLVDFLRETAD